MLKFFYKYLIILLCYILFGRWLVMFDVDFGKEWWILFFIFWMDLNMNGLKYGIYIFLMKLDFFGSFNLVLYWGENKIKNDFMMFFVLVFSIYIEELSFIIIFSWDINVIFI